jgi:hypothetical protein
LVEWLKVKALRSSLSTSKKKKKKEKWSINENLLHYLCLDILWADFSTWYYKHWPWVYWIMDYLKHLLSLRKADLPNFSFFLK